jgi:hypothetical protein
VQSRSAAVHRRGAGGRCPRCVPVGLVGDHRLAAELQVSEPTGGGAAGPSQGCHRAPLRVPARRPVIQVTRKTRELRTRRWRTVAVSAITSLTFEQASPTRLAELIRGTGRSRTACTTSATPPSPRMGSRVRTGAGVHVMACLRNLAIGVLCRAGLVNLAAALRFHGRDRHRPWRPSGSASGWASLHSFPATMLELRLTQRPASRHRWLSAEPAGCSGPRQAERTPRRRCPVVPSLSSQAILMDHCLEVRASGFTRMLAGR